VIVLGGSNIFDRDTPFERSPDGRRFAKTASTPSILAEFN
jgi:hypothetical protein